MSKPHRHLGLLVTLGVPEGPGPGYVVEYNTAAIFCATTSDIGVYNIPEAFLPPGWKMRVQPTVAYSDEPSIWFNKNHDEEVKHAAKAKRAGKAPRKRKKAVRKSRSGKA